MTTNNKSRGNVSTSIRLNEMRRLAGTAVKTTRTAVGVNHVQCLVRTAEQVRNRTTSLSAADPKGSSKTNRLITRLQRRMDLDRKTSVKFMRKQLKKRHPTILMDTRLLSLTK